MHTRQEFKRILAGIIENHKETDCACSRVGPWLPAMLDILEQEEAVQLGPTGAEHDNQARIIGMVGAALLSGSHSPDVQLSVLETFEQ